jgi:hypothetical protein
VAQARAEVVALPALSPELEKARAALDKYRDPVLAVHDGYFSTLGCVEFPEGGREGTMQYTPGGMGVHFLNLPLIGPTMDPAKPQVLIYEPDGDKLRLVAAEWFVPVEASAPSPPRTSASSLRVRWRATIHSCRQACITTTCMFGSGKTTPPASSPRRIPP